MAQKYFYALLLSVFVVSMHVMAQDTKQVRTQESSTIEGLSLYPNPVTGGRVSISTKNDSEKEIVIYDLLGKKIMQTQLSSRDLNVSNLDAGVYIIKITEENISATRKLIIK